VDPTAVSLEEVEEEATLELDVERLRRLLVRKSDGTILRQVTELE
jgi:hypothetical protein